MAKRVHMKRLEEFQPPEKKSLSEKDILVKRLVEKQSNTKVTLESELINEKVFEKSSPVISITNFQSGECSASELRAAITKTTELETWNAAGLHDDDIKMYEDFKNGIDVLFKKHPNHEKDLLMRRIATIENTLKAYAETKARMPVSVVEDDNHETSDAKLLKFALGGSKKKVDILPHPMDGLNELKTQLETKIDFSSISEGEIKQIRKKARKLQNRLNCTNPGEIKVVRNGGNLSKWDVKTVCEIEKRQIETVKTYDCKPAKQQNLYTIKCNEIVRLDHLNKFECSGEKITVEEIKRISRFENYVEGDLNNVLYIKNIPKVTEQNLKYICAKYGSVTNGDNMSIKMMTGKMKGQAFITFQNSDIASSVLMKLNGLIVNGKPLIAQYGKKTG